MTTLVLFDTMTTVQWGAKTLQNSAIKLLAESAMTFRMFDRLVMLHKSCNSVSNSIRLTQNC